MAKHVENQFLAAIPPEEYTRIKPDLESIDLELKHVLSEANEPISHIYFPTGAVISMVITMQSGGTIEIATVGKEGMVGIPVFLNASSLPARTMCQVPGPALRLTAGQFRQAVSRNPGFDRLLQRYTHALFNQTAQSLACNQLHQVLQRCSRWLLMTQDRVGADQFPLTQEFLAQMLGVRRATVTEAANALQQEGLITYTRGQMTIVDRKGLEDAACECYGIIKREYDRLLRPEGK